MWFKTFFFWSSWGPVKYLPRPLINMLLLPNSSNLGGQTGLGPASDIQVWPPWSDFPVPRANKKVIYCLKNIKKWLHGGSGKFPFRALGEPPFGTDSVRNDALSQQGPPSFSFSVIIIRVYLCWNFGRLVPGAVKSHRCSSKTHDSYHLCAVFGH